jgi:predicted Zn-dependent peptidase
VHHDRLPNGLRVCTVEVPHLHSAAVALYVRAGSRYETAHDNGLSHFVEHMLFRGSERFRDSLALNSVIEDRCGMLNGETGRDYSLYQISLHPRDVGGSLEILGDLFTTPRFTDIELERAIVLEEILDDFDERGRRINADDLSREAAWGAHPLGFSITGPESNIRRFTRADVVRAFRRFYCARNMVLCVAGPLARKQVLAQVHRSFGGVLAGRRVDPAPAPRRVPGPRLRTVSTDSSQVEVQLLFQALPDRDRSYTALVALMRILDDGMSTRLHYRVCDQKGLAYHVSAGLDPLFDTSLMEIGGACAPGKLTALVEEFIAILREFRTANVSAHELDKCKRRYARDLEAGYDDVDGLCSWFGGTWLFYPRVRTPTQRYQRMAAVNAHQIRAVAERVLRPERLVAVTVGNLERGLSRRVDRLLRTGLG